MTHRPRPQRKRGPWIGGVYRCAGKMFTKPMQARHDRARRADALRDEVRAISAALRARGRYAFADVLDESIEKEHRLEQSMRYTNPKQDEESL